jgi:class 3 adenylate cyclase/tetratricopeptide (TPR) repeat protein
MKFCGECGAPLAAGCPQCGFENPPGFRFCGECGETLSAEALSNAPPRDPARYTPKHLAEKILQSKAALEGERKQVTVLFADVKGSMELAEKIDPELWHAILNRFFQTLADGVHRFDGTVNQYTGDGIMALFGAPIAHEDHAQRACYAALHLMAELRSYSREVKREHGLEFAVRMGLNSGDVVVGKIGDDLRMDYTAQGHTVGLAQRMESVADAGCICLSESTAKLAGSYFELENLGEFNLKGVSKPVVVHELRDVGTAQTRLDISRARGFSKFVGRQEELAALEASLERARTGAGQIVGVVADAGTGKSRLCFEFEESCRDRGILIYHATGKAHGKAIPLLPIMELFRAVFEIGAQDTPAQARQKIAGSVVLMDDGLREDLPLLFDFLGVHDANHPAPNLGAEARQRRILHMLRRFSHARGEREPAIIAFEDLHWIDPATEAFVAAMADSAGGANTLFLVNFRPEYRAEWMGRSYYQQIALRPLDREAIDEMLDEWLGRDPSLAELPDRILDRTGGTPFFIEEVVQSLIESGALTGARGAYRLVAEIDQVDIPDTVQSLLASRIDRLDETQKQVLQTAAVIGREFSEPLLATVCAVSEDDLVSALRSLVAGEFLFERALYPDLELAFKHPLTQEVAYQSQLRKRRERVHAEVAKTLEQKHAHELDEKSALIAHHWEQAGDHLRAARWHKRAAEWSGPRDASSTLRHFERMTELLDGIPETSETTRLGIEARAECLVWAARETRPDDYVERVFSEGRELAERTGDERGLILLLALRAYAGAWAGGPRKALGLAREARNLAQRVGDPELLAAATWSFALVSLATGDVPRRDLEGLSKQIRDLTADDPSAGSAIFGFPVALSVHFLEATIASARSRTDARTHYETCTQKARKLESHLIENISESFRVVQTWCGELVSPEEALHGAQRAFDASERSGSLIARAYAHWALGHGLMGLGRVDEAIPELEEAMILRRGPVTFVGCTLALAYLATGDDRAEAIMNEVLELRATSWDSPWIDLRHARFLRLSQGVEAADEIEAALCRAAEGIEFLDFTGHNPELFAERAALADLLRDVEKRDTWLEAERAERERLESP